MNSLVDRRRAQLARYVPWMLRDYMSNQGPSTALVVLLIAFLAFRGFVPSNALHQMTDADVGRLMRGLVSPLAYIGTFFATNGIVATDRRQGYYKFLFAKPVSPPAYYLLTFLVYGLGLVLVTLALLLVWAMVVRPALPLELFAVVLLMYLAFGGVGFLLSAAWRFDWMSLVTVVFISNIAWALWGNSTSPARVLLYLLPPVPRTDEIYGIIGHANPVVPWGTIAWFASYGIACLLLGLIVVRKRSLGTA
jgi:hypothetical protein